jgi:hypothetical protein
MNQTIKNILLISILAIGTFFMVRGCKSDIKYNKERKELNNNIKLLQGRFDSLEKVSLKLEKDYLIYQDNYMKDSILIDSLGSAIDLQTEKVVKSEMKANIYYKKYLDNNKKIDYLENNKVYKTGDSLLNSLSKKIN